MDTLFWTQLNPKIEIGKTKKLFFGKFHHRVEIYCPGSSFLRGGYESIDQFVAMREVAKQTNWGGNWRIRKVDVPNAVQIKTLNILKNIVENLGDDVHKRIEEPFVQFYANSSAPLLKIARALPDSTCLASITMPANPEELQALNQGLTLRKRPIKFRYKFNLREARFTWETRQQLSSYLSNLEEQVHVPKQVYKCLNDRKISYIWGGAIYANDVNLAMMIGMIEPNLIRSIEEFHLSSEAK